MLMLSTSRLGDTNGRVKDVKQTRNVSGWIRVVAWLGARAFDALQGGIEFDSTDPANHLFSQFYVKINVVWSRNRQTATRRRIMLSLKYFKRISHCAFSIAAFSSLAFF